MNRRSSLKLLSTLPLLAIFPSVAMAKEVKATAKKADAKSNLLDENDTLAKAMQYKHDASKVKGMRTNKKAFCDNCSKYNLCMAAQSTCKPLDAKALKTATAAPCEIFKGDVKAKGWCLSWAPKA